MPQPTPGCMAAKGKFARFRPVSSAPFLTLSNIAYTKFSAMPQKFCADAGAGYRGTFVSEVKEQFGLDVDISEKIKPHQWEKLPWRWVVERTLSWLNHSRRLSKDYEISISSAETMVIISHFLTLLKRLRIQVLSCSWTAISRPPAQETQ